MNIIYCDIHIPHLICVYGQQNIGTYQTSHVGDSTNVVVNIEANFDLEVSETLLKSLTNETCHFVVGVTQPTRGCRVSRIAQFSDLLNALFAAGQRLLEDAQRFSWTQLIG